MTNGVDDDFILGDFVKDQIWIGRGVDTADERVVSLPNAQMCQKQVMTV